MAIHPHNDTPAAVCFDPVKTVQKLKTIRGKTCRGKNVWGGGGINFTVFWQNVHFNKWLCQISVVYQRVKYFLNTSKRALYVHLMCTLPDQCALNVHSPPSPIVHVLVSKCTFFAQSAR